MNDAFTRGFIKAACENGLSVLQAVDLYKLAAAMGQNMMPPLSGMNQAPMPQLPGMPSAAMPQLPAFNGQVPQGNASQQQPGLALPFQMEQNKQMLPVPPAL